MPILWSSSSSRGVRLRASVRTVLLVLPLLVSLTTKTASSSLYYLTSLTSLLESIAHIIDQHQPVVDKYYGKKRMRTVVGRLVGESDRVVRNLVEGWEEERRVGRLVRPPTYQNIQASADLVPDIGHQAVAIPTSRQSRHAPPTFCIPHESSRKSAFSRISRKFHYVSPDKPVFGFDTSPIVCAWCEEAWSGAYTECSS